MLNIKIKRHLLNKKVKQGRQATTSCSQLNTLIILVYNKL